MIRLSKSKIGKEEIGAVIKVLEKEYLGMGEEVGIFEKDLSNFFLSKSLPIIRIIRPIGITVIK